MSPAATTLSERVRVVLAPNPSPMTLEGTNTYLIGDERAVIVLDPGPNHEGHLARVKQAVGTAEVVGIFVTHHHYDHAQAAESFERALEAPVGLWSPMREGEIPIHDGERAGAEGVFLTAVHTPGHASDHLCFWLEEERAMFTGDHVLGRGTTVVAHPDGDMAAYLRSLERLQDFDAERLYPGHGPVIEDPAGVLREYIDHRLERERQVIAALPGTPEELVKTIYADVDPVLHPVAAMSVRAHLAKLAGEHKVVEDSEERWRLA